MESLDRVQYIHSVKVKDESTFKNVIFQYFDHLMSLYGIIKPFTYKIVIIDNASESLMIDIEMNSEYELQEFIHAIESSSANGIIEAYNRKFIIQMINNTKNILRVVIKSII